VPVGKTLAAARRRQSKTLAEIQAATHIMGRTLNALEDERWDDLPSQVYVKGYIQNYAQALGIDPAPLLAEYAADLGAATAAPKLTRIPGRTIVPQQREIHSVPRQVWILLVVVVAVVGLAIWGVTVLLSGDDTPPPIPPATSESPAATDTVPGVTGADIVTPTIDAEGTPAAGAFTLVVSVAEGQSSWLKIEVDGLTAYEGTLPGGQQKSYSVTDEATVRIGKPAAVSVTRDGAAVEVPLGTGTAEVRLSAEE